MKSFKEYIICENKSTQLNEIIDAIYKYLKNTKNGVIELDDLLYRTNDIYKFYNGKIMKGMFSKFIETSLNDIEDAIKNSNKIYIYEHYPSKTYIYSIHKKLIDTIYNHLGKDLHNEMISSLEDKDIAFIEQKFNKNIEEIDDYELLKFIVKNFKNKPMFQYVEYKN